VNRTGQRQWAKSWKSFGYIIGDRKGHRLPTRFQHTLEGARERCHRLGASNGKQSMWAAIEATSGGKSGQSRRFGGQPAALRAGHAKSSRSAGSREARGATSSS
jgi:hypothetical protein